MKQGQNILADNILFKLKGKAMKTRILLVLISLLCITTTGFTQTWKIAHSSSRPLRAIEKIGSRHFLAVDADKLYESVDDGNTWTESSQNFGASLVEIKKGISKIALTTYGSGSEGLWLSTNGKDWTVFNSGLTDLNVISVSFKEDEPSIVGTLTGIYLLDNDHFVKVSSILTDVVVKAVLVVNETTYLAGSVNNGVYRTVDSGLNWSKIDDLPATAGQYLYKAPNGDIYLGCFGDGLFLSTDNGETFVKEQTSFTTSYVWDICSTDDGDILISELYGASLKKSTTGKWENISGNFKANNAISIGITDSRYALMGTETYGILTTTDPVLEVKSEPTPDGIWKNLALQGEGIGSLLVYGDSLFFGKADGTIMKYDITTQTTESLSTQFVGLDGNRINEFIHSDGVFYVGLSGAGVWKSRDYGKNWVKISKDGVINGLFKNDSRLLAAFVDDGIYFTDDDYTWEGNNSGLSERNITSIVVLSSGKILASAKGDNGIYQSLDNGNSWFLTSMTKQYRVYELTVLPNDWIYAGTGEYANGLYISKDNGETWEPSNFGMEGVGMNDEVQYVNDSMYLQSDFSSAMYYSSDGLNWKKIAFDATFQMVPSVLYSKNHDRVFVATLNGLWEFDYKLLTTGVEENLFSEFPTSFKLHQNYPNPFNPITTIPFSLDKNGLVSLQIFNVLGQQMKTIYAEKPLSMGEYRIQVDMSSLPSGLYLYEIQFNHQRFTRTMTFMK